jgi:diaminopimelate decarboxylase
LCFGGDFLSKGIDLPVVNETDYILVQDVGAYTFSMWSRYNSRQMPKIIGYKTKPIQFSILKEREDINQVLSFWK